MKNIVSMLSFKYAILIIAVLFIIQSCDKKDVENTNCLAVIVPDTLRFNVINEETGEDLFFSTAPVYTTDQIYFIFQEMNIKPKVETSAKMGKHFYTVVGNGIKTGTMKAFIADKLEFNIEYQMKQEASSACPKLIFDNIRINGNQFEENLKGRVVQFKM